MKLTPVQPLMLKELRRRQFSPVTRNQTKLIGDQISGEVWYCTHLIMRWDKRDVWFFPPGYLIKGRDWTYAGPCTVKRWFECTRWIGVGFHPHMRNNKLKLWLHDQQRYVPFTSGRRYSRNHDWGEKPIIMNMARRPDHYTQEVMPAVKVWKDRKPAYVKQLLLARRKIGDVVIQLTQHNTHDFFYEAFVPSPYKFTKHKAFARIRFRKFANAVRAFHHDAVTLLEPMEEEEMYVERTELPYHEDLNPQEQSK